MEHGTRAYLQRRHIKIVQQVKLNHNTFGALALRMKSPYLIRTKAKTCRKMIPGNTCKS